MEVKEIHSNDERTNLLTQLYLKIPFLREPFCESVEDWKIKWNGAELTLFYKEEIAAKVSLKKQKLYSIDPRDLVLNQLIKKLN